MTQEQQQIVWTVENTHPELIEPLKEALREVVDPEIGLNVVELGLIRDVTLTDDKVRVNMILTTPFCPYGPALLEMTRQKVEGALVRPTSIEVGMEMWDPTMMEEGAGAEWGLF